MMAQLLRHVTRFNLIPSTQSGFRRGFSCETASLQIIDKIFRAFNSDDYCFLVLLDFFRALGTINHDFLLAIFQYLGEAHVPFKCLGITLLEGCRLWVLVSINLSR